MNNQYDTLSKATGELKERGYSLNFNLQSDRIFCKKTEKGYKPDQFIIDEFHRFEGISNPGDMSIVFAIPTSDGGKGTLVDAYGTCSDPLSTEMIKKMKMAP